jgi:myo-inositol-1-phosphate synthase
MSERVKAAVIGVGNNISALVQGIALSRTTGSLDGVRMAALALRQRRGGYLGEAAPLLKSPPGTSM